MNFNKHKRKEKLKIGKWRRYMCVPYWFMISTHGFFPHFHPIFTLKDERSTPFCADEKTKKSKKIAKCSKHERKNEKYWEKKIPLCLNQLLAIPFFTVICITYYNLEAIYDSFYFNKSRSLENEHDNNFEQCRVFFLRVIRPEQGVYTAK